MMARKENSQVGEKRDVTCRGPSKKRLANEWIGKLSVEPPQLFPQSDRNSDA
jgi:hypothetical protein